MKKKIKNLKISEESHEILKKYCDKHGIKIYKFVENLIKEKCSETRQLVFYKIRRRQKEASRQRLF